MSERDDEVLRRYRAAGRDAPPPALDAAILAASRRAVRASPVSRWAAPVSIAAVLVLALGLVLKVQREAPEAVMPAETRAAPAASSAEIAPAPSPEAAPTPPPKVQQVPSAPEPAKAASPMRDLRAKHEAAAPVAKPAAPVATQAAPEAKRVEAPARRQLSDAAPQADVAAAPRAADAMAPQAAPAAQAAGAAPAASAPSAALDSNAVRAPAAAAMKKSAAPDPLQRELERIARLREEGKSEEADAALATFQREHPGYRIEPAVWDRVRRR